MRNRRGSTPFTPLLLAQRSQLKGRTYATQERPRTALSLYPTMRRKFPAACSVLSRAAPARCESFAMNRRRKVARLMPRAAEFATGSRQSLGLSVITNEGSTTKKLIVAMRLFGPHNRAIIKSIIASNQDARYGLRNVQKTC